MTGACECTGTVSLRKKKGNYLSSRGAVSFSRTALFHGVKFIFRPEKAVVRLYVNIQIVEEGKYFPL